MILLLKTRINKKNITETDTDIRTRTWIERDLDFLLRIIFRSIVYSSCSGGYYIWYFFIAAAAATDSITITRWHIAPVNHHYTEKNNGIRKERKHIKMNK